MPDFGAFNFCFYPPSWVRSIPESFFSREYSVLLKQLLQARKESGVTQNEVAHRMGVVRSIIGKIERGERRLDVVELRQYCLAVGIPLILFIHRFEASLEHLPVGTSPTEDTATPKN